MLTTLGLPSIEGVVSGNTPSVEAPEVIPSDYYVYASYILKADGTVEDSSGLLVASGSFQGWLWTGDRWEYTSDTANDGTYYIETSVRITGNPGTIVDPWRVTIISEGTVEITSEPQMQYDVQGLLIVAGGDFKVTSGINLSMMGTILVREQIYIASKAYLYGAIWVQDGDTNYPDVVQSEITQSICIAFNSCYWNLPALNARAMINAAGFVQTKGTLLVDGRDYDLNLSLRALNGALAVSTLDDYKRMGNSKVGGTVAGFDFTLSRSPSIVNIVTEEYATDEWKQEGGFPTTPDGVLALGEGTLKKIAMGGFNGSQYVTDPDDLTFPLSGVTYVEMSGTWKSIHFGASSGILVVHNSNTDAIMKNLNSGSFEGIIITDDLLHIHSAVHGVIYVLAPTPSSGHCIGNGGGVALFSREAIAKALETVTGSSNSDSSGTPSAVVAAWIE